MNDLRFAQLLVDASTWLLTFALHSLICHAAALAAARTIVIAPRQRSILFRVALLAPLASATLITAGIRPRLAIGDVNIPAAVRAHAPAAESRIVLRRRAELVNNQVQRDETFATDSIAQGIAGGVIALTLASMALGLVTLIRRRYAFERRLGTRLTLHAAARRGYRLTTSATLGAPVAIGIDEICVPTAFDALSPGEQQSVLAHEAAHLGRRDPAWFALADAMVALFPWQPLVRPVVRELRRSAEFCCDDAALAAGGDGRELVRSLATFAAAFDPAETAFAASCGGSPLEERARRILAGGNRSERGTARWVLAVVVLVLAAGVSSAPAVSTRTRAEAIRPDGLHRMIIREIDSSVVRRP